MRHSNVVSPRRNRRIGESRLSSCIVESESTVRPCLIGNLRQKSFGQTTKWNFALRGAVYSGGFLLRTNFQQGVSQSLRLEYARLLLRVILKRGLPVL